MVVYAVANSMILGDGFGSDELKFNDNGMKSGVGNGRSKKWFVGSSIADSLLDKLLEEKMSLTYARMMYLGIVMEFATIEVVKNFYQKYSLFIGFRVRRDDRNKNKRRVVISRRWVCNKVCAKAVQKDEDGRVKKRKE